MTTASLFETASDWLLENATDDRHRPGHLRLIEEFLAWISAGCPRRMYSVCMCCRYGKCDACRNMALLAIAHKQAGQALVIHPAPELAEQFTEAQRMKEWRQRWLPVGPRLNAIVTLRDFTKGSMCNGQWLGSIHIHALIEPTPRRLLKEWIDYSRSEYGVPPIIFFDEGHHFAGNVWGRIARDVHAADCLTVPLTATAFRQDEDDIFGFRSVPKDPDALPVPRQRTYTTAHPTDNTMRLLHTSTREETTYEIHADTEVPFSQGWTEGHIAKASFDLIDWQMKGWGSRDDERLLSELPKEEARYVLQGLYRDPAVIREAVVRVIRHINTFRKESVRDATVIWYGMDDADDTTGRAGTASENQKTIKRVLNEMDSSLDVRIATLATDSECDEKSEKARATIKKFSDNKTRHFDVLLLKAMGALGLDCDRVCVVVLWNTTRSLGQMIQMAMRGGNTRLKNHFVIVALKDAMTTERLQAFVEDEGGEFVNVVETDHQVVPIPKNPTPDGGYIAIAPADVGMGDTDGRTCSADEVRLALFFLSHVPQVIGALTIPQIAETAKALGISTPLSSADTDFVDSEQACDAYRDNLEGKVKQLGKRMFWRRHQRASTGTPADLAEHGDLYRQAAQLIKERAGVRLSWDKNNKARSSNPADYKKWTVAADALLEDWR